VYITDTEGEIQCRESVVGLLFQTWNCSGLLPNFLVRSVTFYREIGPIRLKNVGLLYCDCTNTEFMWENTLNTYDAVMYAGSVLTLNFTLKDSESVRCGIVDSFCSF
jgi:hypothetical protein